MKYLLLLFIWILFSLSAIAQSGKSQPKLIEYNVDSDTKPQSSNVAKNETFKIKIKGSKENVKKFFSNSTIKGVKFSDVLAENDKVRKDSKKGFDAKYDSVDSSITIDISLDFIASDSELSVSFSKDGKKKDVLTISIQSDETLESTGTIYKKVISDSMQAVMNRNTNCNLCDLRSTPTAPIKSKKDRKYTTDYIIIYDPLISKDAYTICKHVFEKVKRPKGDSLYCERYIKIAPKMFAPAVGSEILFEVINQSLSAPLKLKVDEKDVFNGGATQFSSLISGLTTNILTTPGTETPKAEKLKEHAMKIVPTEEVIDNIASEVLQYVVGFRISTCSVQEHYKNLPQIFKNISNDLGITASNATMLLSEIKKKIEKDVTDEAKKEKALQQAEAIVSSLKSLENVKPLAYTTARAKNRDYIEVIYTDANNVDSKPEYIRMSGGMKIDYSAGFVLTGLRDFTYALKNQAMKYNPPGTTEEKDRRDTTGNVIIKEDDGKNNVGVGILTHFYPRLSSHYNIGGTVGLMTSTNLNLRLMLGGSFMVSSLFGSNNRVSFSYGRVWGKVARLSTQHEDFFNKPRKLNGIPQFYSQAAAPQPIQRNEGSWFFAITMNFGGN